MVYREDGDLEFLGQMESADLNDLVLCLIHDRDGAERMTGELLKSELYKKHQPDHHQYWQEIAAEIQCFGANTFATMFRSGKGVLYREVLTDVCSRVKVKFNKDASVNDIENELLMKILSDSLKKMSEEELRQLAGTMGLANSETMTPEILLGTFQLAFVAGGFMSYQLALTVANAVANFLFGRGLALAGNITLSRGLAVLAGPIGLILTGIWTAVDIAGPAYRVTIPAVVLVATLRRKWQSQQEKKTEAAN